MGKDDGDFTHRMRIAGYRILELPDALVLHRSRPRSDWLFYYQIRNRWHFMLKNYQWRTLLAILPCLAVHEPLQLLVLHAKGHGGTYWKAVRGLMAMLPDLRARPRAGRAHPRACPTARCSSSDRLIVRDDLMRIRSCVPARAPTKDSCPPTGACCGTRCWPDDTAAS